MPPTEQNGRAEALAVAARQTVNAFQNTNFSAICNCRIAGPSAGNLPEVLGSLLVFGLLQFG